jgi:hypothetical protein
MVMELESGAGCVAAMLVGSVLAAEDSGRRWSCVVAPARVAGIEGHGEHGGRAAQERSFGLRGQRRTGKGKCVGDGMAQGRVTGFGVGRDVARNRELVSEANYEQAAMT